MQELLLIWILFISSKRSMYSCSGLAIDFVLTWNNSCQYKLQELFKMAFWGISAIIFARRIIAIFSKNSWSETLNNTADFSSCFHIVIVGRAKKLSYYLCAKKYICINNMKSCLLFLYFVIWSMNFVNNRFSVLSCMMFANSQYKICFFLYHNKINILYKIHFVAFKCGVYEDSLHFLLIFHVFLLCFLNFQLWF